ncbi:Uncharacterised protein [Mycobacteroides abscessus subsp. abscessus]|nr:Uncharacterised protein [Mycobacteroides abscessus subsp. abscessus]
MRRTTCIIHPSENLMSTAITVAHTAITIHATAASLTPIPCPRNPSPTNRHGVVPEASAAATLTMSHDSTAQPMESLPSIRCARYPVTSMLPCSSGFDAVMMKTRPPSVSAAARKPRK